MHFNNKKFAVSVVIKVLYLKKNEGGKGVGCRILIKVGFSVRV